ncbi:MAG: hypothetical protein SFV53_00460 [Rickettsiales bacterium]|nr:hypothetical protein [Rickettsiales bacterium]
MTTTLTTKKPAIPTNADFAIYIDFKKETGNPQRIFQSSAALISSFEKLDKVLCDTIDSKISPIMMLEEIEIGSLKIWLKSKIESIDDRDLKELNWKSMIGKYLVKAKYLMIDFLNKGNDVGDKNSLINLSRQMQKIAEETNVKHLPDYKSPNIADLVDAMQSISSAKNYLDKEDRLQYLQNSGESLDFNLSIDWTPEKFEEFLTKEKVAIPEMPMNLVIKKPDYLGNSMWELRHGKVKILAKITDENWLLSFQQREIDVRPGDALRCKVKQELYYGFDNELIAQKYVITKVDSVLENQYKQRDLFKDDE